MSKTACVMADMEAARNFRTIGRTIIGIGRNYRAHAAELNNPVPSSPILFSKPVSSYISQGSPILIPEDCSNLHHEVELGVVIGKPICKGAKQDVSESVAGYVLALDMTARDFQDKAKKNGTPWLMAKGFDTSCPVSDFIEKDKIVDPQNVDLWLKVNGELKQEGNTKDMIFDIPSLIQYITKYISLSPGDLILTGTPSGVGPVVDGDEITCGLGTQETITFPVRKL